MSVYKMTVNELAKKRAVPVKEFLEDLASKGFDIKSGSKKLTQEDLDAIALAFTDPNQAPPEVKPKRDGRVLKNPNALIITNGPNSFTAMLVETTQNATGGIEVEVVESITERSKGAALLEYKRLRGMNRVEDIF